MKSSRPEHLPELAAECLEAISRAGLGSALSIGGALGLLHYHDYRSTRDVDLWWQEDATPAERERLIEVVRSALEPHGEVTARRWGEVVSIDLARSGVKTFSLQVAKRSARLERSEPAPWVEVLLDSPADLLASKMVALIERGAPRDFRDVHAVCRAGLFRPEELWELWRLRLQAAGEEVDLARAALAVETHLSRIERYRPLDQIEDASSRQEASSVRSWIKGEFLDAAR